MKACTFCLQTNVKVSQLGNSAAVNFIQEIFLNNGFPEINKHNFICDMCNYQLNKSYDFFQKTLRAQKALQDILEKGIQVTVATLRTIDRDALKLGVNLVKRKIEINYVGKQDEIKLLDEIGEPYELKPPFEIKTPDEIDDDDKEHKEIDIKSEKDYSIETVFTPLEYYYDSSYADENDYDDKYIENDVVNDEEHKIEVKIDVEPFEEPKTKTETVDLKIKKRTVKSKGSFRTIEANEVNNSVVPITKPKRKRIRKYVKKPRKLKPVDTRKYPMGCEICKHVIPTRTDHFHHYLLYHRGIKYPHSRESKFICQHCGIGKTTQYFLGQHEKTHGEKKVECSQCGKLFHNEMRLQRHLKRHGGSLKYCDYCNKGFVMREDLILHIRTHTGVKPFKCMICDATFAHRGNVTIHMRSRHQQQTDPGRAPLPAPKRRRTLKPVPDLIEFANK